MSSVNSDSSETVTWLLSCSCSDNVIEEIQSKLQDIRNPMAAMMVLLREMDLETDSEVGGEGPIAPGRRQISGAHVDCI